MTIVVRPVTTEQLSAQQLIMLRELFAASWPEPGEEFTEDDWDHTIGGTHFVVEADDRIVSHASVVPRELQVGDQLLRTGYVEAVATWPDHRRRGFASAIMGVAGEHIDRNFQLGALGSELRAFYARFGWETWPGPSYVRTPEGPIATPEEDGYIMIRATPTTPPLDRRLPISCEWRRGDAW